MRWLSRLWCRARPGGWHRAGVGMPVGEAEIRWRGREIRGIEIPGWGALRAAKSACADWGGW